MPYGSSKECVCQECKLTFLHAKKLSEHIKTVHKLTPQDYTIIHCYDGVKPKCLNCNITETRYVTLGTFNRFCKDCAATLASQHGKVGGSVKKTWSKGLTKENNDTLAKMSENSLGEKNHFFGKKHTKEAIEKIADAFKHTLNDIRERINDVGADLVSDYDVYNDQNSLLQITCKVCNTSDEVSLFNVQRCWHCKTCHPNASKQQLEVSSYITSLLPNEDIHISTRKIITPLELDVWLPNKNLAVEYHGLYWHSGGFDGTFDKSRHRQKYIACKTQGIRLFQFFSDEWLEKQSICKSMIRNALHMNEFQLNARDCKVLEIKQKFSKEFLEANHINGSTRAKHHLGLYHKSEGLVGIATVRIPIQKKWGNVVELARMAFRQNTTVRGGAGKLMKHVVEYAKSQHMEGVLSYAELRYGEGNVYEKIGLKLVGESPMNYWYTDGIKRFDRFRFRAQKPLTEKQVAEAAGVRPVWGCGNRIFLMKF